jgi:tripartite-type tricarboxylate transporter receptor subunit TctC
MAGLDVTIVPFRSSGEVLVALERGDVQVGAEFYAALRGGLEAKKVIPLATSGAKRTQYLPDVPTMKEAGAGTFEMTSWSALFAKAKTSPDVISALSSALKATLSDREIEEKALELGVEMAPSTPQEIGDRLAAEIPKWAQVVQAAHIEKR